MTSTPQRSWIGQLRLDFEYKRDLRSNPRYSPDGFTYIPLPVDAPCSCGANHSINGVDWSGVTRPITLTYRQDTAGLGNVLLRGFQLADMLVTLGAPVPVTVQALENLYRSRPREHILIVLKSAIRLKSEPILRAFARWKNTLLFDLVDGLVPPEIEPLADAYICASLEEQQSRDASGHRTIVSLQSPDQRTPVFDFDRRSFAIGYYGLPENVRHLTSLPSVTAVGFAGMPRHRSPEPLPQVFEKLRHFSHHYSVRHWNERDGFKPMMKGFFAARLGAVIVGSRGDIESRLTLGEDYPYLAESSELTDVRDMIEHARFTHLGPEWHRAKTTMETLRVMSCPVATAGALIDGLRRL